MDEIIKTLKIMNKSPHEIPSYAKNGDSGMDLRAWLQEGEEGVYKNDNGNNFIVLKSLERRLIHTGIYVELPWGCEWQVRPKSGQALKKGLSVVNTPGTVDYGYRNEIGIIAINLSDKDITIEDGEKIAQAVLCPVFHESLVKIEEVDGINANTDRALGGFGHTGIK